MIFECREMDEIAGEYEGGHIVFNGFFGFWRGFQDCFTDLLENGLDVGREGRDVFVYGSEGVGFLHAGTVSTKLPGMFYSAGVCLRQYRWSIATGPILVVPPVAEHLSPNLKRYMCIAMVW